MRASSSSGQTFLIHYATTLVIFSLVLIPLSLLGNLDEEGGIAVKPTPFVRHRAFPLPGVHGGSRSSIFPSSVRSSCTFKIKISKQAVKSSETTHLHTVCDLREPSVCLVPPIARSHMASCVYHDDVAAASLVGSAAHSVVVGAAVFQSPASPQLSAGARPAGAVSQSPPVANPDSIAVVPTSSTPAAFSSSAFSSASASGSRSGIRLLATGSRTVFW